VEHSCENVDKSAWIFAELDQLAGTLALRDSTFARYLPAVYGYWFGHFVDPVYGEVWNGVDGKAHMPLRQLPKEWKWKNAYHSFGHALVGYIVAQQLHGELVTLYYAFAGDPPVASVQPNYFSGEIAASKCRQMIRDNECRRSRSATSIDIRQFE
jgi:hypothetical protein